MKVLEKKNEISLFAPICVSVIARWRITQLSNLPLCMPLKRNVALKSKIKTERSPMQCPEIILNGMVSQRLKMMNLILQ